MIGPTGIGKTEIARRLAKLAQAPFIKVEATKFTEVGYVGRDVEQIVRDLIEVSLALTRERLRKEVESQGRDRRRGPRAGRAGRGRAPGADTRAKFRKMLRGGELDDREIEIQVQDTGGHAELRDSRHAGGAARHGQSRRDVRQDDSAGAPSRAR